MLQEKRDWKMPAYLIGGLLGVAVGVASAHFYTQSVEENQPGARPVKLDTGDLLKLGLAAIGMVRLVSDIGAREIQDQS